MPLKKKKLPQYCGSFFLKLLALACFAWFACKASEPLRSKNPPAMRVETNRLTKKSPFRTIEVSKPLLRKER